MPKIAYEIGIDPQRKVTKEWVQDKLNSAKALMQGRIDEENLCADNLEQLMKTIKDRPTEVVAYDNCMKFFQERDGGSDLGTRTPYEDLFLELVKMCKASPDVAVVGGTLDSEIVSIFTTEDSKSSGDDVQLSYTDNKIKDMELPPNYIPMTWDELADLMIANNYQPKKIVLNRQGDEDRLGLANADIDPSEMKKYILDTVLNVSKNDFCISYGYTVNWSKSKTNANYYTSDNDSATGWGADVYAPVLFPEFGLPEVKFVEDKNIVRITEKVQYFKSLAKISSQYDSASDLKYTESEGATTIRLIPEILCKVV